MADSLDDSHHDFVAANRIHFDQDAEEEKDRSLALKLAKRLNAAILEAYPFDDSTTQVMDFACGIGLNSREILPYVHSVVGVDISPKMIELYNQRANNQGLSPDEMRAVCIDLKGADGDLDGIKFDVVMCCMSYHHFPSIVTTTAILSNFLKGSGALIVCDFRSSDGSPIIAEEHAHIVPHRAGFQAEEVRDAFQAAGLVEFSCEDIIRARVHDADAQIFIAKGTRRTAVS